MIFSKLLKVLAFFGVLSISLSASAAPVSCNWQYAGGGGGGGSYTQVDVCIRYFYNGSQITGAELVAQRTKNYTNGYLTNCSLAVSSGYGYSGSCNSPSFYTTTPTSAPTTSSSASSSSAPRQILFSGSCSNTDTSCFEREGRRCGSLNGSFSVSSPNYICKIRYSSGPYFMRAFFRLIYI
jgi:hypothetical protein